MLDPRSQSAVWRFGRGMFGHSVDFAVVFTAEDEDARSRVDARLEYPAKDGARGVVTSSPTIATGRVNFSFVFEAFGDLRVSLSYRGKTFFDETV